MLVWNPTDVLQCLEVIPEVEEYETEHVYTVQKDGLRLELCIHQYSGDIFIDLYREGINQPALQMRLIDCNGVRYISEPSGRGEYLEFAPSKCFNGRYDGFSPIPYGVRIGVKPSISIVLF